MAVSCIPTRVFRPILTVTLAEQVAVSRSRSITKRSFANIPSFADGNWVFNLESSPASWR